MNNYNYEYDYMNYPNNINFDNVNFEDGMNSSYRVLDETDSSYETYNDKRVNYMPNMDNYKIQFLKDSNMMKGYNSSNSMLGNMNTNMPNTMTKSMTNSSILEPYNGFVKGNMFVGEFEGYKNYKPRDINSSNERENMLNQLQQYVFALIDLDLYLDVNPNDSNAIRLYNNYLGIKKQITDKYESMYGPLTLDSDDMDKNSWVWIRSPWPWEVM